MYQRDDAELAVINRGPLLASDFTPSRRRPSRELRPEEKVVNEGSVLIVTLAADLFVDRGSEVENDVDLLLRLSEREEGIRVVVNGESETAAEWRFVRRTSYSAESCEGDSGLVDAQPLVDMLNETGGSQTSFETVAQLMMTDARSGGLFVTCDENLLDLRSRHNSIFAQQGIVSPAEAVSLAYAVQRGRGLFTLDQPRVLTNVGETGFFSALTRVHLPNALAAYRTQLDPENSSRSAVILDLVESMMEKYHSLLIATDDCGRLHLAEGLYGGSFSTLRRFQAIAQTSLMLVSGLMDIGAHIVAELSENSPSNPSQISWRHLIRGDTPVYKRLSGSALSTQLSARALQANELEFVAEARNLYAHRTSLPGLNSSYHDASGTRDYARYCVFDFANVADLRGVALPEAFLGTFCDGNEQPFYFQLKLVALAREVIESLTSNLDRSSSDWYAEDRDGEGELNQARQDVANAARWWKLEYELRPFSN